jgi:WD40 repeat protein
MKWYLLLILLVVAGCAPGNRAEWREQLGTEVDALGGTADGNKIFSAAGGVLTSRDATTGEEISNETLDHFEPFALVNLGDRMVAFSPGATELVWWPANDLEGLRRTGIGSENTTVEELEVNLSGITDLPPGPTQIVGAGMMQDGTLAVCDTYGRTSLWNQDGLSAKIKINGPVAGSGMSPDGRTLVLVDSVKLHFYRLPQAAKLGEIRHESRLRGLRFSPDGAYVAAILAEQVKLINTDDLSVVASLPGLAQSVSFSADGRYFCATNVGSIDVWDLEQRRARGSVVLLSVVQSEVLGTAPHVLTLRKKGIDLWSLEHPDEPIWSYRKPIRMMATKPDGVWVYTASGWLESWRLPLTMN